LKDHFYEMSNGAPGEEINEFFNILEELGVPESWE
jgi:hypothetical protein